MKILNRPMFRYGGPIKEGIMDGIREPKRNGGSMGEPQATYGVGNNMNRDASGREKHALFLPALYAAGAAGLRMAARPFGKYVAKQFARPDRLSKTGKIIKSQIGKGGGIGPSTYLKSGKAGEGVKFFEPNKLGKAFINDPLSKAAMSGVGFTGKTLQKVGGGIKYATTTPSGLLFLGAPVTYSAGKYFLNSGEEIKGKDLEKITRSGRDEGTSGAPGGGDPGMYLTPEGEQPKELTPAEREALEAEARMKKMDKYKEIMDIKGMNKDAAYKSLIDASKIISEGGNLKKQLKDGSLIQKVTAAASKRFDKVTDTENALRSLVAKGEIDNEMNKEIKALARRKDELAIKTYEKQLKGLSTAEIIQKTLQRANGEYPVGDALRQVISINNPQLDAKVIPYGDMPTGADALEYVTTVINKRNNDETTPDYPEGVYIIKDRIIQVIDGQVMPISINQLK